MEYSTIFKSTIKNIPFFSQLTKIQHHYAGKKNDLPSNINALLQPVFSASYQQEFFSNLETKFPLEIKNLEKSLIQAYPEGKFHLERFCLCCNTKTKMLVDYQYSVTENGISTPNWRERLVCQNCQLNNRQRMISKLVQQHIAKFQCIDIYFMEQVTPIYRWVKQKYSDRQISGSEYLGYEYPGGTVVNGIRHEDVMSLSFESESIDLIISNDVFEHVPDVHSALKECARILRPGGQMIATIPFHVTREKSEIRAALLNNELVHLLPPQYHGNPISADGCLVFHDFGWELLDHMREAGFSSVVCEVYASDEYGHLGHGLIAFRLSK